MSNDFLQIFGKDYPEISIYFKKLYNAFLTNKYDIPEAMSLSFSKLLETDILDPYQRASLEQFLKTINEKFNLNTEDILKNSGVINPSLYEAPINRIMNSASKTLVEYNSGDQFGISALAPLEEVTKVKVGNTLDSLDGMLKTMTTTLNNWSNLALSKFTDKKLVEYNSGDQFGISALAPLEDSNIPGKANGGFIRGMGTGTSDSILTMLSNGEYVVNAKSAAKNLPILEAINKGYKIPGFATGGLAFQDKVDEAFVKRLLQLIENLELPKEAANWLMGIINFETIGTFSPSIKSGNSSGRGLIQFLEETAKGLNTTTEALSKMTNVEQLDYVEKYFEPYAKNIKSFYDMYAAVLSPGNVSASLDKTLYAAPSKEYFANKTSLDRDNDERITKKEAGDEVIRKANAANQNILSDSVLTNFGQSLDTNSKNMADLKDATLRSIQIAKLSTLQKWADLYKFGAKIIGKADKTTFDQLTAIKGMFGYQGIGASISDYSLYNLGKENLDYVSKIFDEYIDIETKLAEARDVDSAKEYYNQLENIREEFKRMAELPEYLRQQGKSFSDNIYNSLATSLTSVIKGEGTGKEITDKLLDDVTTGIITTFIDGLFKPLKDSNTFEGIGKNISSNGFNIGNWIANLFGDGISQANVPSVSSSESSIIAASKVTAQTTGFMGNEAIAAGFAGMQSQMCSCLNTMQGSMQEFIPNKYGGYDNFYSWESNQFSQEKSNGQPGAVAVGGVADPNAELSTTLTELFTGFSTNLSSIFTGIVGIFQGGFSGLLGIGLQLLSPILGMFGIQLTSVGTDLLISGAVATIVTLLGTFLPLIAFNTGRSLLATGGFVSGPGTGTSDSIPAMLSNGEYVINAKATRQFKPLLDSINSGGFKNIAKGFATGGLIGGQSVMIKPIPIENNNLSKNNSNQVVNINITGDISRQTKSEIYRMIPEITSGVNTVNKSRNYRG